MKSQLPFFLGVEAGRAITRPLDRTGAPAVRGEGRSIAEQLPLGCCGLYDPRSEGRRSSAPQDEPKSSRAADAPCPYQCQGAVCRAQDGQAPAVRAVAPRARMRQAVAGAILICDIESTARMTKAASPSIRRAASGCVVTKAGREVRDGSPVVSRVSSGRTAWTSADR